MTKNKSEEKNPKLYYYVDISLVDRQIIGWGIEERGEIQVELSKGFHRIFLSKGQYNKLIRKLVE